MTLLQREVISDQSTIGKLSIGKEFLNFTLEDVVRDGPKIYGKTAIPVGVYKLDITESSRFKKRLPIRRDVPGFEGIRIH